MFRFAKQKNRTRIVFGVYCLLLVWLVLFKFATSLSALPSIRIINLIPFYYGQENPVQKKEVLLNILVFVPLGVYVQILKAQWKPAAKAAVSLCVSLLFETVQYILAIGASDITDILGNTLGGIIGILLCTALRKIAPEKYIPVINTLGLLIELAAIGLLVLLLMVNR